MDNRDGEKTSRKNSHYRVDETAHRTIQAFAKRNGIQSHSSNKEGRSSEPARMENSCEESTFPQNDASGLVTLHLPEPINAALQGGRSVFRRFVHGGWDANPHTGGNHDTLETILEGLCGSSILPLALRHTVSTPCVSNVPAPADFCTEMQEDDLGPPIALVLDPFQRSTSTPTSKGGSFGTAGSAFTLAKNSFVNASSQALERRHSASAFGPSDFYSLALQDAVEQASIEVEHRPEKTVSRFLSSNVRILRRRKSHGDRSLPVTVLEGLQETSRSEELSDENPNNTSTVSQLSELSGIVPIVDFDEVNDPGSAQSSASPRDNTERGESPPLTPATVSTTATLNLSTASETDREVAEATSQARRNRREDASRRFLALRGGSLRDGATLPVDRFFRRYPSPLLRHPTSSTASSSLQSTTTGCVHALSSLVSSSQDPPTFVSYHPSENDFIFADGCSPPVDGEASPAHSVADSEALYATEESPLQYRIRSGFVTPNIQWANEQGTEVSVVSGSSPDKVTTVLITPEK